MTCKHGVLLAESDSIFNTSLWRHFARSVSFSSFQNVDWSAFNLSPKMPHVFRPTSPHNTMAYFFHTLAMQRFTIFPRNVTKWPLKEAIYESRGALG